MNARLLADATYVGESTTMDPFILYDFGEYPAIIRGGETPVAGEVYDVSDKALRELDLLEEHPDYYRREIVRVEPHGRAWIYILTRPESLPEHAALVPSGDWFHR